MLLVQSDLTEINCFLVHLASVAAFFSVGVCNTGSVHPAQIPGSSLKKFWRHWKKMRQQASEVSPSLVIYGLFTWKGVIVHLPRSLPVPPPLPPPRLTDSLALPSRLPLLLWPLPLLFFFVVLSRATLRVPVVSFLVRRLPL